MMIIVKRRENQTRKKKEGNLLLLKKREEEEEEDRGKLYGLRMAMREREKDLELLIPVSSRLNETKLLPPPSPPATVAHDHSSVGEEV